MRTFIAAILILCLNIAVQTATAQEITEANYDKLVPAGKEVDAIYGDFAINNTGARAVIAAARADRNANMTVRTVGGCLIDFAVGGSESDQLSAFYPGRRKFPFSEATTDDRTVTVTSPGSDARPRCVVKYEFPTDQPVIHITSTWTNTTASDWTLTLEDDIRIDSVHEDIVKSPNGVHDLYTVADIHWRQAYGVRAEGYRIQSNSSSRELALRYEAIDGVTKAIKPGESFTFTRQMIVAEFLPHVRAIADQEAGIDTPAVKILVKDSLGAPIADARIAISTDTDDRGTVVTEADGTAWLGLPQGEYTINGTVAGIPLFPRDALRIQIATGPTELDFTSKYAPGIVKATITDDAGQWIPAKVEFDGVGDTPSPNWGPNSGEHFIQNLAYTANGTFKKPLAAGEYDVTVSHGSEHDVVFTKLKVEAGKTAKLDAILKHSVQTPGWISADFHSHSSPSGDNTGSQKGRVLNLAAEHIEFAPCTEHNRVSTYAHHITELKLEPFLATVTGMELTGSPLPLNHQNAFPMRHTPRTQDGGGPQTDTSPESQIERLMLWDDRSEKLIQQDHPDIGWLFYDRNGDGVPDEGYSRSFPLIDVMEIHPIDSVLKITQFDTQNNKPYNNQRILNWLQLLNQGFRIYGVVNTDAHYNWHGSGWLRNWIQSSTDDPSKIDAMEMVHASEQGRLIMSNGPYIEATFTGDKNQHAVSGQELNAASGNIKVHVKVQCPNWFDVDTVCLLINGKTPEEFRFTRSDHPTMFSNDTVKFDQQLDVTLTEDSHIVVVTGHRTEILGDVAGPMGSQHPAALTNPVFVDVDGKGFSPSKDTLGYPLPVKFKAPE
jgi:hypothetical protein